MSLNTAETLVAHAACIGEQIVGIHPSIQALRQLIDCIASSTASIMITGPSGSGKEVVARAIHDASDRCDQPFIAINCGAIPAELIESELFGHERGSFTGAQQRRVGRFEEADGGTLFLDEIGDMRFDMQVKLLRVLEERMISRVGGNGALPVDVRIICATHQDINAAIDENRFREDLYFRLSVVPVVVPDLASRACDIPLLVDHFQASRQQGAPISFTPDGLARLQSHDWPGNVRELRNVVERARVLHGGQTLNANAVDQLLDLSRRRNVTGKDLHGQAALANTRMAHMQPVNLKDMIEAVELEQIRFALEMADGVISEAARLLTMKRTTLIEKIRKYGVSKSC